MLTIEERILRSKERTKRLETEQKLKIKREEDAKRKLDTRRQTFSGKLLEEHFPMLSQFQPQRTEAENRTEFEFLNIILSILSDNKVYISHVVKKAELILKGRSQ